MHIRNRPHPLRNGNGRGNRISPAGGQTPYGRANLGGPRRFGQAGPRDGRNRRSPVGGQSPYGRANLDRLRRRRQPSPRPRQPALMGGDPLQMDFFN